MRVISTAAQKLIDLRRFQVVPKIEVKDSDGAFQDLSNHFNYNWLKKIIYGEDVENQVASLNFSTFARRFDYSLQPLDENSVINRNAAGAYKPLLELWREVKLSAAVIPIGKAVVSGDYSLYFHGRLDGIDDKLAKRSNVIDVMCRDLGALTQNTWIESEETYGSDADADHTVAGGNVEDIIQKILDNWSTTETLFSLNGTGGTPFNAGDTPGFTIANVTISRQSVMDAIRFLADAIGWEVRYRYQTNRAAFELILYEPRRAIVTPDHTVKKGEIIDVKSLRYNANRIRNAITIEYYTDPDDVETKESVTQTDATSIAKYGRRWAGVIEAAGSAIDSGVEAIAFGDLILSDLSEPDREQAIELLYFPFAETNDYYRFKANKRHYTSDKDWAIVSVKHVLDLQAKKQSTILQTRGKPTSGSDRKWKIFQAPTIGPNTPDKLPQSPDVTLDPVAGGLDIDWDNIYDKRSLYFDVHLSLSSSFTPDASTRVGRTTSTHLEVQGLIPGASYFCQVQQVDTVGNVSGFSSEIGATAGFSASRIFSPESNFARSEAINGDFGHWTKSTEFVDAWEITNGVLQTNVDVDLNNSLRGRLCIQFLDTGTQRTIESRRYAASPGRLYRVEFTYKGTIGSGGNIAVDVLWKERDNTPISTSNALIRVAVGTVANMTKFTGYVTAPSNAAIFQIQVDADADVEEIFIDEVRAIESLWGFKATLSGDQSLTSTVVATIGFNTAVFNRGSAYNNGTFKFTAPVAGDYNFGFGANPDDTHTARSLYLSVNGAAGSSIIVTGSSQVGDSVYEPLSLAAGDTVEVKANLTFAGSNAILAGAWFFGSGPLFE